MTYRFATAEKTVLPVERAKVFFDGIFTKPRLQHAEGVAIGPDGHIWCGSENGEVLRIAPDGSQAEVMGEGGGFTLGLAFDGDRALYFCDLKDAAVFRLDLKTRWVARFTGEGIRIPNYPVVDAMRSRLLVSDSHHFADPGPGVWAYDLATGEGGLWYDKPLRFANGMALSLDGSSLYVCETFAQRVTRIPIQPDGSAGDAIPFAVDLPGLPDGIAFDDRGYLFVGCYEPSRILRVSPDGKTVEIYIEEPTAHLFAHPTNIAFDGAALYTANLGRWHITRIDTDTTGAPLWRRVAEARPR
ncbi:MAG TPA: SMP-30/gluconolactonase/LRE family protein [Bauldia sp.]|nr:SMP-30/gluconolactonase/LRE family protein [Bauldia sp.]